MEKMISPVIRRVCVATERCTINEGDYYLLSVNLEGFGVVRLRMPEWEYEYLLREGIEPRDVLDVLANLVKPELLQ